MSLFLIDYENVREYGLKGLYALRSTDTLIIFYSNVCKKIRSDNLTKIENTKCSFKVIKLLKSGKNAIDFYIATTVGESIGNNEREIGIISNDKGLQSIVDYYDTRTNVKVSRSSTIEKAIMSFNNSNNRDRRSLILHLSQDINLDDLLS